MDWTYLFTSFEGRINRKPYWIATLVLLAVGLMLGIVIGIAGAFSFGPLGVAIAILLLQLVMLYPALAIMVKRLHDRNRPSWWAALIFVPTILNSLIDATGSPAADPRGPVKIVIGLVVLVVSIWFLIELGFLRGTAGENRYGPDPLA